LKHDDALVLLISLLSLSIQFGNGKMFRVNRLS